MNRDGFEKITRAARQVTNKAMVYPIPEGNQSERWVSIVSPAIPALTLGALEAAGLMYGVGAKTTRSLDPSLVPIPAPSQTIDGTPVITFVDRNYRPTRQ